MPESNSQIKDKIFRLGIYGTEAKNLTKNEQEELKNKAWVEVLAPYQLESFKKVFTLSPLGHSPQEDTIPDECIVRMNLHAWRAYLFGTSFITTNRHYFVVTDYLLRTEDEYVSCSNLRTMFDIEPKTMHYICKNLKKKGIIEDKKVKNETYVKLCDIKDSVVELESEDTLFKPYDQSVSFLNPPLSHLVFYSNIPFIKQLKNHVYNSENGFGTKALNELTGMKAKMALKHLQKLAQTYPEEFKLVDSIEHGHTAFKVFAVNKLEERNKRKIECMKNQTALEQDPLLSSNDRKEALKILAEKYGHFVMSKEIIEEISKMTGYPYQIDRKNLLKNASEAGLKNFELPKNFKYRNVIALPSYDESVLKHYKPAFDVETKFFRQMKNYFLNIERFILLDNGYCDNLDMATSILGDFLYRQVSDDEEWREFDAKLILEMPVSAFFKITKIKRLNFLVKTAFEFHKRIENSDADNSDDRNDESITLDDENTYNWDLFLGDTEPKKINPLIFKIITQIESIKMAQFIEKLTDEQQEFLNGIIKPQKYLKKLERLRLAGELDLSIDETNRITFKMIKTTHSYSNSTSLGSITLNYNSRVEFVSRMRNETPETFRQASIPVISEIFSRSEQKMIGRYIDMFLKEHPTAHTERLYPKNTVLLEHQHDLYLTIKKALLFGYPLDTGVVRDYENTDIEAVVEYLVKKEIASGFRSLNTLRKTVLNAKFKAFMGDMTSESMVDSTLTPTNIPSITDSEYFQAIYPKLEKIIEDNGSIDFAQLTAKSKFFEGFEIGRFLEEFQDKFEVREVEGFRFISKANLDDPFS